ncbi:MHF histone-fold complex component [Asimina triloba]
MKGSESDLEREMEEMQERKDFNDMAEQLAKDLELFARHANRKSVNIEDVILAAHRNEHLAASLRSFSNEVKMKEAQNERKRKKPLKNKDKAAAVDVMDIS